MAGLTAEEALGVALAKVRSSSTGIVSHSVSGLTLTVVFADDTSESITFDEPQAVDVASAMLDDFNFSIDPTDGHLKLTVTE